MWPFGIGGGVTESTANVPAVIIYTVFLIKKKKCKQTKQKSSVASAASSVVRQSCSIDLNDICDPKLMAFKMSQELPTASLDITDDFHIFRSHCLRIHLIFCPQRRNIQLAL